MTKNDRSATIGMVSIHDMNPRGYLSFDLLQILEAIEDSVREYAWVADEMECTGAPIPTQTVLSFDQLVDHARRVQQMIDGTILGFPRTDLAAAGMDSVSRLEDFPTTSARIAILAVDSSFFEVIAKDLSVTRQIQQTFADVRVQDPGNYFSPG